MDVEGAYYSAPVARTRFTRTLHGAGATQPRGGTTIAMRPIDAWNVDAFAALDDVIYAAGGHVDTPWAVAHHDLGAAADDGASTP